MMVYFMENPVKMDDLEVPLFQETSIFNAINNVIVASWVHHVMTEAWVHHGECMLSD